MTAITLTSKGQATIPKQIRDLLGVKPHGRIAFEVRGAEILLRAVDNPAGMLAVYAQVKHKRTITESVGRYLGAQDAKTRAR